MDTLKRDVDILENLKQQYQKPIVYELFKKYQTLLMIKKIINKAPVIYQKKIDISKIYPEILSSININYDVSLAKYDLYFQDAIATVADLLKHSEGKLNLINLLLINNKLYNLEFIDFILPIATCEKILKKLIIYLYDTYSQEYGCYQLYKKYINPDVLPPQYIKNNLNDYSETIINQLNLVYTIKDYLNVKVDDYHKNNTLILEKKNNETLQQQTEKFNIANDAFQKITIEYINCIFYFKKPINYSKFNTFLENEFPNYIYEILDYQENNYMINIVFDCLELYTIDAITLHKKLSKLIELDNNRTNIFKYIDVNQSNLIDLVYKYEITKSETKSKNINQQINIFGSIEEKMNKNQIMIYNIIMRFYKTTNITMLQKKKIETIIQELQDLKFTF